MSMLDAIELARELSAATGIPVERGRWPHVRLPRARTVQRLSLEPDVGGIVLRTWPAELMGQAKAFYGDPSRVESVLELCRTTRWNGTPRAHLSYWQAPPERRWHFTGGRMALAEYLEAWTEDLVHVHAYPREDVAAQLWPWLTARGYAGGEEDRRLMHGFLDHARPQVHLRPAMRLSHRWTDDEAHDLVARRALRRAVREEADRVLGALAEQPLTQRPPG